MLKILFLIITAVTSSSVCADWLKHGETDDIVFYYDPSTIRKDGNIRRLFVLEDYAEKNKFGGLSSQARTEIDCNLERYRFLSVRIHSDQMGGGKILESTYGSGPSPWSDIPPKSVQNGLFKIVCAK
jgi:hypothetical protein